jgi:hypothetical protein
LSAETISFRFVVWKQRFGAPFEAANKVSTEAAVP